MGISRGAKDLRDVARVGRDVVDDEDARTERMGGV
jgi:hypothetical protein